MDSTGIDSHRKSVGRKRSFGKYPDSPAYDASEEDNDPLTEDDAVSINQHPQRTTRSNNFLKPRGQNTARHHLAFSDSDGVDSPTYDGDVESSTTAGPDEGSRGVVEDFPPTVSTPTEPQAQPFNPAALTPGDIQSYVQKAIDGDDGIRRDYKINKPPEGRPIRIYADGVYDLFHFGHALQLRQAKLSFPNVYLLVGVCSDELVQEHKARGIMTHAERIEALRHCRWVDQVVPEAPWVITSDFIQKYQIDYVAHDEDPYKAEGHDDVYWGVKVLGKFLPTRRTPGISTSALLERIVSGYRKRELDEKLLRMGRGDIRAEGSDYDDSRRGSIRGSRDISPEGGR